MWNYSIRLAIMTLTALPIVEQAPAHAQEIPVTSTPADATPPASTPPPTSIPKAPRPGIMAHKLPPDWLWADNELRLKWRTIVEPSFEQSRRIAFLRPWFERVISEVPSNPKTAKAKLLAKEKMCEAYLAAYLISGAVRRQDDNLGRLFGLAIKHGAVLPQVDADGLGRELMLHIQYMRSNHKMYESIEANLDPKLNDECRRRIHSQTPEQIRLRMPPELQGIPL